MRELYRGQGAEATWQALIAQIRTEYRHVPTSQFRPGRRKVLTTFLERPQIYFTDWFRERYEAPARKNLERALVRLAAKFF